MKRLLLMMTGLVATAALAQYEPQVGEQGSTAVKGDSTVFKQWASGCTVTRGYQDVSQPAMGYASVGTEQSALGKAGVGGTLTLGDGGSAVLTFPLPIVNGPGADFAVFENGFRDNISKLDFLEYAFVEVSSDGLNFVRFPAAYSGDTTVQVSPYEPTDTRKYHNLAGKYWGGYGTPFDLEELKNEPGLNVNAITHVKVVDVVGSLDPLHASRDANGRKINDPWPTSWASGGFDLDAVGVIHHQEPSGIWQTGKVGTIKFFPNPAKEHVHLQGMEESLAVSITDLSGQVILQQDLEVGGKIDVSTLKKGTYLMRFEGLTVSSTEKLSIE